MTARGVVVGPAMAGTVSNLFSRPLRAVTAAVTASSTASGRGRFDAIDAARAAALAAMATYHALWDLGFLQLTPISYALTPAGRIAAHVIAGSFLTLVGIGLVLMNRERIRWRPFLMRLARIGGAALLLTLATRIAFPDSYIFFGILHCIAVSSVLALPFLFLPAPVTGLAAAAVLAAPSLVKLPIFEATPLMFLGLGHRLPETNDWVPLFPWFGFVLIGVALARFGLPAFAASRLGRWQADGPVGRLATLAGRHSLAVYLVHQPLLLALFFGLVSLTGPNPRAGLADFRAEFQGNCTRTGGGAQACRIASRCIADVLRREGLWGSATGYTIEQRAKAQSLAQACYQAAEGTAPPP